MHVMETTDLYIAVLIMQLTRYLLTILCTTADGQLTSRSRLESIHKVSQGRVPTVSGHINSSLSNTGLDICMVG